MGKLHNHFSTRQTAQSQPIPGREADMVANSAGGYTFKVDPMQLLDRFLILGTEGGTYYIGEAKLTQQNARNVLTLIKERGVEVVARIVEIVNENRAPRRDPALFALAMAAQLGDDATRAAALNAVQTVCRIPTDLFNFATYLEAFGGWGRAKRRAVSRWYNERDINRLAMQVVKYRQRNGWTHRDLLRLAHPSTSEDVRQAIYRWITKEGNVDGDTLALLPDVMQGFLRAQQATKAGEVVPLIKDFGLTWEMVPTELLKHATVWQALLAKMPMGAMVRNLGRMTANGAIKPLSATAGTIIERLEDESLVAKSRLHPLQVILALKTYSQGGGHRGRLTWTPVQQIVDALNSAFYSSFKGVQPTGKNFLLGLDVSGSMCSPVSGVDNLSCAEAAAIMAMATARVEKNHFVHGFTSGGGGGWGKTTMDGFVDLGISPKMRLDNVMRKTSRMAFGGTDCALPMLYAAHHDLDVDVFVVYTDNETWAGNIQPVQALQQYRQKSGRDAKLVVCGMASNGFTIADPNDAGMMDVVGFDTSVPAIISDFATH